MKERFGDGRDSVLGDASTLLVTVLDAARILQLSRTKVYELMYSGELVSVKIGTCRRIRLNDLEAYVQGLASGS